jgi:hypothetical protein
LKQKGMAWLGWIGDDVLENIVKTLLEKSSKIKKSGKKNFHKNVIDPFSTVFQMTGFDMSLDSWREAELARQTQKSLQNHVGTFHQNILGSVEGWANLKIGKVLDIVNKEKLIIAEIKNKYNTVTGGKLANLYYSLENIVMHKASIYRDYTAYFVQVVPGRQEKFNRPFTPSDKEKGAPCPLNEKVREVDGATFYALVTGSETALFDLFKVLPDVIEKVAEKKLSNSEREELIGFFNRAFG